MKGVNVFGSIGSIYGYEGYIPEGKFIEGVTLMGYVGVDINVTKK